jgi:hypothetical protein
MNEIIMCAFGLTVTRIDFDGIGFDQGCKNRTGRFDRFNREPDLHLVRAASKTALRANRTLNRKTGAEPLKNRETGGLFGSTGSTTLWSFSGKKEEENGYVFYSRRRKKHEEKQVEIEEDESKKL